MNYSPPKPLDVVLNPVVLSKYHRIFAFNLRLMRVTNVVAALFRMTRKTDRPLFPTLTHSNRLVLHFGFVAQSFLASLSSYVYDKAIRGRFDALLDALSSREKESSAAQVEPGFSDIFALAKVHAQVLDNILSACLLRSGQKAVGDVLRNCIELILELGILAGERYRGRMEEYQAAGPLEDLWARFSSRMATLVKVLKALVDRGAGSSGVSADEPHGLLSQSTKAQGVTGDWQDLLLRLDMADWWSRIHSRH